MQRIYLAENLIVGSIIQLPDAQAHHLTKVLRLPIGSQVILFNGDGADYTATLSELTKKHTTVTIQEKNKVLRESPLKIHLGQCLARGERMDFVFQKAVELGVSQITPIQSEFSQVKLSPERMASRMQHWQNIAISACEQTGRNVLPEILPPQTTIEWIKAQQSALKLCFHFPVTNTLSDLPKKTDSVSLLVGPEGGLSDHEAEQAKQHGFDVIQIGPRILRTETAGMVAVTIAQTLWGDL